MQFASLARASILLAATCCSSGVVAYAAQDADPYPPPISGDEQKAIQSKYVKAVETIEGSAKPREVLKIAAQLKATIVADFEEKRRSLYEAARVRQDRYFLLTRGQPAYELTGGERKQLPELPQGAGHFRWSIAPSDPGWEQRTIPQMKAVKYAGDDRMTIEQQPGNLGESEFYVILPRGGQSVVVHSYGTFRLKQSEINKLVAVEVAQIRKLLDETE